MLGSGVPVAALAIPAALVVVTAAALLWARRRGTLVGRGAWVQVVIALLLALLIGCWAALAVR